MTAHGDYSPAARERASHTVEVAAVFADAADRIVADLPDVPEGHVLVAIVSRAQEFTGTHLVERATMVERVPVLENGGWGLVVSPGSNAEDVRRRAGKMADLARQRVDAIDRITARRAAEPNA
jgi:hypothetical protein